MYYDHDNFDNFKREADQEFRRGDYVAKKTLPRYMIIVLILVVFFAIIGFAYNRVRVNVERETFKHSIAYTESAAQVLSKEYQEYNKADNDADRNAIMQYVVSRYPNLDSSEIEDKELREFYKRCLRGN